MFDTEKVKKYLKKYNQFLLSQHIFRFGQRYFFDKKRVDDLICCIEGSMPKKYFEFTNIIGGQSLQSYIYYKKMLTYSRKQFFNFSIYVIQPRKVIPLIQALISTIDYDCKIVSERIG